MENALYKCIIIIISQNQKTMSDWFVTCERKWILVSADVRGGGTRDDALRTSAWEASKPSITSRAVCIKSV